MFAGSQGYVEVVANLDKRLDNPRIEDDEAFVLELEDYLDKNKSDSRTDGISRDVSKMSMKGFTEDPYLSNFNKEFGSSYQSSHQDVLTPLQSSFTSFLGSSGSESSTYWSSSPETTSGVEETPNSSSTSTYFLLPNSYSDSFQLSYDVNLSATADQINIPSSNLSEGPVKSTKISETKKDEEVIIHQLQPMSNSSAKDDVMVKVEVEDSYGIYETPNTIGQSYFNDNNSYAVIKAEVPERMMELNNHTVSIPCPICGMGETGTHNHYGGRACTSCRAFFRRSVQTNSYKNFKCQNASSKHGPKNSSHPTDIKSEYEMPSTNTKFFKADAITSTESIPNSGYTVKNNVTSWGAFECRIDSRSWKSCRFCRFNKCIASGMRPGWVLTKEERILRQNKRTKNKKTNQNPTSPPKVYDVEKSPPIGCKTCVPKRLVCPVMPNELKQIDQRQKCFVKLSTDNYIRYFVSRPQILMDVVQAQHYQKVLPYEAVQHLSNALKGIIQEAMTRVRKEEIGKDLPVSDCLQLVENNAELVCNFHTSVKTSNKPRPKTSFEIIKAGILKRIRSPKDDEERDQGAVIKSVYDALNIEPNKIDFARIRMKYWQFFSSPWASSVEYEERHLELARQMSFWPILDNNACVMEEEVKNEATLNTNDTIEIIDDLQVYLMSAILAFSTDGIVTKLSRPDVVDRIQEYYLTMLHRYLKYRYGDAEAINRLSRGMQITSMAREAKEICKTRLLI